MNQTPTWMMQGFQLHQAGQLEQAILRYQAVLGQNPQHPDALHLVGLSHHQRGNHQQAVGWIRRAIAANDGVAFFHNNLAEALAALQQFEEAEKCYRQAFTLQPEYGEAYHNLAIIFNRQERHEEAIALCRRTLEVKPGFIEAWFTMANAQSDLQLWQDAEESYRKCLAMDETHYRSWSNLGNLLSRIYRLDEALRCYQRAVELAEDQVGFRLNLGNCLKELGRLPEVLAWFRETVARFPDSAEAHYHLANSLLLSGHYPEGWREYAWRWQLPDFPFALRKMAKPKWDGKPLAGRTLLIHAEQGFGDSMQFLRYVPLAARRGGRVILEVQKELFELVASFPGAAMIIKQGDPLPPHDCHAPMLDLPLILGLPEPSPAAVPYLQAKPEEVARWQQVMPPSGKKKVGLVWAGRPTHVNDHNRSLDLDLLKPLLAVEGIEFYSLQKGTAGEELAGHSNAESIQDLAPQIQDFCHTAAILTQLDLLITVDTSVAHLAGAMGRPVWTLLPRAPDWRWQTLRPDTPWYPTMRLFRQQEQGNWQQVVEQAVAALTKQWD
ncbi:MAG: tetratricopeptide repeat protein [Magnetococcales bacterium]|nr:tetratricopeptide repeat protein [Magnetococcales bacterium]